jgi:hypothetical protein
MKRQVALYWKRLTIHLIAKASCPEHKEFLQTSKKKTDSFIVKKILKSPSQKRIPKKSIDR